MSDRLAVGPTAVPVKLTCCGLVGSLSVIRKVAVLVPLTVGWNVTLMLQVAPASKMNPQVLVWV